MYSTDKLKEQLVGLSKKASSVLDPSITFEKYSSIDISTTNDELKTFDVSNSNEWESYIEKFLSERKSLIAYGGYLEKRSIYKRSNYFSGITNERNIHLGVDFWTHSGCSVHAALAGTVHSFENNLNHGDYGPTIILEHRIEELHFYSLYGHLSLESIRSIHIGQAFETGELIARIGDSSVNGDYAPHLHFQLILNIEGYFGDYPGVCSQKELDFYSKNCPDPLLFFPELK